MDYPTKKSLHSTDENIIFPTDWLSKKGGITSHLIHGRLDYTPTCCIQNVGLKTKDQ